jgi:hypothetical protein
MGAETRSSSDFCLLLGRLSVANSMGLRARMLSVNMLRPCRQKSTHFDRRAHVKDSLWSVDLFRCESMLLRSLWVMVVMDVFTRPNYWLWRANLQVDRLRTRVPSVGGTANRDDTAGVS